MSARATWKGAIVVGRTRVPVKLYSAVEEGDVRFRLLHAKDHAPVRQSMVHPEAGKEVPRDQLQMGYEVEPGVFVTVTKEELDALQPEASRDMEVEQVVPRGSVGSYWYERPYWLTPDGDDEEYAALAEALQREKRDAVIRWVMRGRKRVGVLRARVGHLLLVALREADEVVPPNRLEAPPGAAPEARELKLAQRLVQALEGPFEPERYRDTYQDRVKDLIAAKAKGKRLPPKRAPRKRPAPASLAGALAASLREAGKERRRA